MSVALCQGPIASPWLPRGLEFLSGLPTEARKRRLLLALQVFIDDSGVDGTQPVVSIAGFFGQSERWAEFSNEWKACLDSPPPIRYLKINEAAKLDGEFRNWLADDRDAKLKGFVDIMSRFPEKAIYATLDTLALRERPHIRENVVGGAYWGMFFTVLAGVCYEILEAKSFPVEPFEIIFDEHSIFVPRINLWYPYLRDLLIEKYDVQLEHVLPRQVLFKDDEHFLPLQAADVIAWHFRITKSGQHHDFEWIADRLAPVIPVSAYSGHWDARRMDRLLPLMREYQKESKSSRHIDYLKEMGIDLVARQKKRSKRKRQRPN